MKVFCTNCGIHFPYDFQLTLSPLCNFWGEHGMANLPLKGKEDVWNWLFHAPADSLAVEYNLGLAIMFHAQPIDRSDTFEDNVPGWDKMTEQEKQDYERQHFKNIMKLEKALKRPDKPIN